MPHDTTAGTASDGYSTQANQEYSFGFRGSDSLEEMQLIVKGDSDQLGRSAVHEAHVQRYPVLAIHVSMLNSAMLEMIGRPVTDSYVFRMMRKGNEAMSFRML